MNYTQALEYIHAAPRFKGKASLERMRRLCALLGDPQKRLRFVHVAGTNGKGSTVQMIAGPLRAAGYRTGTFISPFVLDFRERIQVDGVMIPREGLCEVARRVREADGRLTAEGLCATEFELVTACGLLWFEREGCDVVVLEVGIGGRFDATNVIPPPAAAVITRIALDHTAILGGTVEQIAFEKCGIIKGGAVVCYPEQDPRALAVIREQCKLKGGTLHLPAPADEVFSCTLERCRFRQGDETWEVPLGGAHQVRNALTALKTLDVLRGQGFCIPAEAVRRGLLAVRFPARLERVRDTPPVLIDGAHNPDGMAALTAALAGTKFTAVFAAMQDKDYAGVVAMLAGAARRVVFCGLPLPRAARPEDLLAAAGGPAPGRECAPDFSAAFALAREGLQPGESVVVCGSLYLASEARQLLCGEEERETGDKG